MGKITSYNALTTTQADDLLVIVDVHDTSMAASGTDKKITVSNLLSTVSGPWQFRPDTYGAKGDGKVIGDATIAGGALSTMTSASAGFTSADTGKYIMINGAGAGGSNNPPLITTITFVNATTVTLAAAASGAVTNASAIYGTDDTAAINSAVAAAHTYALANAYFAQVLFRPVNYCLATGPTQQGDGSTTPRQNSQIPLPYPNVNGSTQKEVIEFVNLGGNSAPPMYFDSTVPNLSGTCLVSMVLAPASGGSATFGPQSVIGGPSSNGSLTGGFANIRPVLSGITIITPYLSQQMAADLRFTGGYRVRNGYTALAFAAPVLGAYSNMNNLGASGTFQNGNSVGFYPPIGNNNDDCAADSVTVEGFTYGVSVNEHFSCQTLTTVYEAVGVLAFLQGSGGSGTSIHGITIGYWSCEATLIALQSSTSTGNQMPVSIALMDNEVIGTWDIQDANSALTGIVHWNDVGRSTMNVQGAANLEIINARITRTVQAAPSYTLGTAFQNPWWRHAWVTLNSGTTTGILIGPTSAACTTSVGTTTTTPVSFRLPSGWWLNIQGSVKPATFTAVLD